MDKRRVTIYIGHRPYSFYSTDSDEYIRKLEEKANQVLKDTANASRAGFPASAVLSVVSLSDELLRQELEKASAPEPAETPAAPEKVPRPRKAKPKQTNDENQVSIWDLT